MKDSVVITANYEILSLKHLTWHGVWNIGRQESRNFEVEVCIFPAEPEVYLLANYSHGGHLYEVSIDST